MKERTLTNQRVLEEVARCGIRLLLREPFYAHILSGLHKRILSEENPAGGLALALTDNYYELRIHPAFWDSLQGSPDWRYGLLKHEVLHLLFRHPLIQEPYKDRLLFDMALDLVVNQYIEPVYLSPDAITLSQFPELELPTDQSWRFYYEQLEELQTHRLGRFKSSRAGDSLNQLRDGSPALKRHASWNAGALNSVETSILESLIGQWVEQAARKTPRSSLDELPERLRIQIEQPSNPGASTIDWRRVLRLFAAGSARTRIRNTIRRPSKRYGTSPGIQVKRLQKLLVAVDTSGSIRPKALRRFFREIHHIWRQGAEIRIVECDAQMQNQYEYRGQTPAFVAGGGGTRFEAPIRYGNRTYRPDGLIYFTDGFAPAPQIPARFPILWVITPDGLALNEERTRKLPGRKIKMGK